MYREVVVIFGCDTVMAVEFFLTFSRSIIKGALCMVLYGGVTPRECTVVDEQWER